MSDMDIGDLLDENIITVIDEYGVKRRGLAITSCKLYKLEADQYVFMLTNDELDMNAIMVLNKKELGEIITGMAQTIEKDS